MKTTQAALKLMIYACVLLTGAAGFTGIAKLTPAHAATCIPGLPCNAPLTPNDPANPADGPNAVGASNANKSESAACDADFMNQIYARAFLEASREYMYNEVIVRKPDSVLEYTCFDQILQETAEFAGPIFTESPRWQSASVPVSASSSVSINVYMGDTRLDGSLDDLIMESLNEYLDTSFSHDFLGGTSGSANTIASSVGGAQTTCTHMNDMFFLAKCNTFGLDDRFMTFEDLIGNDLRIPDGLECTGGIPITQEILDIARNKNFAFAAFDTAETKLSFLDPDDCEPPIPTGLLVIQKKYNVDLAGNVNTTSTNTYNDSVCSNPGCYFDGSTCKKTP